MGRKYEQGDCVLRSCCIVGLLLAVLVQTPCLNADVPSGELRLRFYSEKCPNLLQLVRNEVATMIQIEPRNGAALLRLHFHDCFVDGCDGSVLLDDHGTWMGEKNVGANNGSLRGFELVDTIKAAVEKACPETVSCADILALSARDSVVQLGGPHWDVPLGRRDSLTASRPNVLVRLPGLLQPVDQLNQKFANVGLSPTDMVVLSGAHTVGKAKCSFIVPRLYNFTKTGGPDPSIGPRLLSELRKTCPENGNPMVNIDMDKTSTIFDNSYYKNLLLMEGALFSDQELQTTVGISRNLVKQFAEDQDAWFREFNQSMIRMGNITPLTGNMGEIRSFCRKSNPLPYIVVPRIPTNTSKGGWSSPP